MVKLDIDLVFLRMREGDGQMREVLCEFPCGYRQRSAILNGAYPDIVSPTSGAFYGHYSRFDKDLDCRRKFDVSSSSAHTVARGSGT